MTGGTLLGKVNGCEDVRITSIQIKSRSQFIIAKSDMVSR